MSEFQVMLNQMAEIWPDIKNQSRAKRCYDSICDLEKDFAQSIVNHFVDNFTKMPLPADFVDASKVFKKHFYEKHGYYYGSNLSPKTVKHEPDCSYCYDSGFEWIEIDENSVFAFCFCKAGDHQQKNSNWLLPKTSELGPIRKKIFPVKSFIPKEKTFPKVDKAFLNVVDRFSAALKESQDFWAYYYKKS